MIGMKSTMKGVMIAAALGLAAGPACTEPVGGGDDGGEPPGGSGEELVVEVPAEGHAYVRLADGQVVEGGEGSAGWDLALSGYDVLTNSGPSGPGEGGAFGPLGPEVFDEGEEQGAPVSALYQVRYAEVLEGGAGPTVELADVDARAGGSDGSPDAPSECVDLGSGARVMRTPEEAAAGTDWHLCFRRDAVSVNGELGGPRGARAVDLHAGESAGETVEALQARTPASEAARFDAVGHAALTDPALELRGDRVVSAFSGRWADRATGAPAPGTWVVQGADGTTRYLVTFDRFEGASEATPGRVVMWIRVDGGAP